MRSEDTKGGSGMKRLYEKNELTFAIVCIVVYCVLSSVANPLNKIIGIESFFNAVFNILLTIILFCFVQKNGLLEKYGFCKSTVPARKFLWYIPLVILATHNLWNGIAVNFAPAAMVCYICNMLCVGFVEEVIFRGFLFRAMAKDNIKTAIAVSSITFGAGHLLNLVNGRGMGLVENLCQVTGAIAIGFLFVIIFYRGGSLIPCILTHSAIDVASAFANDMGHEAGRRILFSVSRLVMVVVYTVILLRVLPEKQETKSLH